MPIYKKSKIEKKWPRMQIVNQKGKKRTAAAQRKVEIILGECPWFTYDQIVDIWADFPVSANLGITPQQKCTVAPVHRRRALCWSNVRLTAPQARAPGWGGSGTARASHADLGAPPPSMHTSAPRAASSWRVVLRGRQRGRFFICALLGALARYERTCDRAL